MSLTLILTEKPNVAERIANAIGTPIGLEGTEKMTTLRSSSNSSSTSTRLDPGSYTGRQLFRGSRERLPPRSERGI